VKNKWSLLILVFCLNVPLRGQGQVGCKDPQAINYNASALVNDGSCIYPNTNFVAPLIDSLTTDFNETSGLVYWNNFLYAHNDGGNAATLYKLDTFGKKVASINLLGITNVDWENITQDATHFYIADVGNNNGNRTDLKIYKFSKALINNDTIINIADTNIEVMNFSYADQTDFTSANNNTKYDCEAIIYYNGLLHLFTKNWVNAISVHYTLPTSQGTYTATRIDSLNGQGILITGADATSNGLVLCGYQAGAALTCAMWYIFDYNHSANNFLETGNKRKLEFGTALTKGQVEGICFKDSNSGYISSERFNPISIVNVPPSLYSFSTSAWYPYQAALHNVELVEKNSIYITPFEIHIESGAAQNAHIEIYDLLGCLVHQQEVHLTADLQKVKLPFLIKGNYILNFKSNNMAKAILFAH
jgi:hypothetical protein